jgi:hypothetical protein
MMHTRLLWLIMGTVLMLARSANAQEGTLPTEMPVGELAVCLIWVQSVVVDPADLVWILDTGSIEFGPTIPDGP